jgi:hypothetical protein
VRRDLAQDRQRGAIDRGIAVRGHPAARISDPHLGGMPGEFFFMAFGGLGVSLAGFAGLISALDRTSAGMSAISAYRIRTIVVLGFGLTFAGFGTVAAYTLTGSDLPMTVRIGTVLLGLAHVRGLLFGTRPGPEWPDERERRVAKAILVVTLLVTLGNLAVASVGYLEALLLVGLVGPVSIFYNTIRAATEPFRPSRAERWARGRRQQAVPISSCCTTASSRPCRTSSARAPRCRPPR